MRTSVLITGCSTGSAGSAIAREYSTRGLHVFATARRLEAMADLQGIPSITLISLDVTSLESICSAREKVITVLGAGRGLDVLVNNAGVTETFAALDQDLAATKRIFEANVFGMMAMVQEFTPLLMLSSDACIVNVGSIVALGPFPFGSSYSSSKAAVHSYSDTLRLELRPLGIKVVTVGLGGISTNMSLRANIQFPEASYYKPIESTFQKTREIKPEGIVSAEVYARRLVNATLKASPARHLNLGSGGTIVPWVAWLMPTFLLDYILSSFTGLNELSAMRKAAAKTQ